MKRLGFLLILCSSAAWAANSTQSDPAGDQARQDYKVYLQQLKAISQQYQQVVGEIKDVLKEEGVPTVDENTGALVMKPLEDVSPSVSPGVFGDADIQETEKEVIVKMDLPGVRKEDIRVNLEDGRILKIAGQREIDDKTRIAGQNFVSYKAERQRGSFERRIELPVPVQEKASEARYENGVLSLRFLKLSKKETSIRIL